MCVDRNEENGHETTVDFGAGRANHILVSVTGWGAVYVDVETTGGTFMIEMDVGVRHGEATDGYFDAVVPFGHLLEMEQGRE